MDMDSDIQTTNNKIDTAIPRQLVLDYLLHNCYGETARAFMKDDLDAVKDVSDLQKGSFASGPKKNSKGRNGKASHNHSAHRNGTDHAQSHMHGGLMTRNASDESQRRTGSEAGTMMETEDDDQDESRLDHEGDSPMGESYSDSKEPILTAGTFTADKAHALHIDEQLKNLETRKGTSDGLKVEEKSLLSTPYASTALQPQTKTPDSQQDRPHETGKERKRNQRKKTRGMQGMFWSHFVQGLDYCQGSGLMDQGHAHTHKEKK